MLDRASTFASPEVHALLKEHFVPVAIDQFNQIRQEDAEGRFWRKLAEQGPRDHQTETTQGFYMVTAGGKLLAYGNNRGAKKLLGLLRKALDDFEPRDCPSLAHLRR